MEELQNLENLEDIKEGTQTLIQKITSNNLYYGICLVILLVVLMKVVDLLFKPFLKKGSALVAFLKAMVKVFICTTLGFRLFALLPGMEDFASTILLSSSLLVVVLGFVFQEGLSNIVHGFILSVFHPFNLGDRVTVTIDGEAITGYIREITARHTIIQSVFNSAHVIVPNAKMDSCVIVNNYYGNDLSSSFLDMTVTYESDILKAIAVLQAEIVAHPLVKQAMKDKDMKGPPSVNVRDLAADGVCLRATVYTRSVEENFRACSDIRKKLVCDFARDPSLQFAYPHTQVVLHPDTEHGMDKGMDKGPANS